VEIASLTIDAEEVHASREVTVHVDAVVHARSDAARCGTTVLGWVVGPADGVPRADGASSPVRCPVSFGGPGGRQHPLVGRATFDITFSAVRCGTHRLVVHAAEAVEGGGAAERELPFAVEVDPSGGAALGPDGGGPIPR